MGVDVPEGGGGSEGSRPQTSFKFSPHIRTYIHTYIHTESRALYNKARNDYNTLTEKTKRKYYNNALKNNKDPRMLNKNLDDLI